MKNLNSTDEGIDKQNINRENDQIDTTELMYLREQLTNNNKKANKTIIVSAPVRVSNKRPTGHDGHLSTIAAF